MQNEKIINIVNDYKRRLQKNASLLEKNGRWMNYIPLCVAEQLVEEIGKQFCFYDNAEKPKSVGRAKREPKIKQPIKTNKFKERVFDLKVNNSFFVKFEEVTQKDICFRSIIRNMFFRCGRKCTIKKIKTGYEVKRIE